MQFPVILFRYISFYSKLCQLFGPGDLKVQSKMDFH